MSTTQREGSDDVVLELGEIKKLPDGKLRFELLAKFKDGGFSIKGFRYDPETDKILPPSFRIRGGYQPIVQMQGSWIADLLDALRALTRKLTPPVPTRV